MKKLATIAALVFAGSPAAAQVATPNGQAKSRSKAARNGIDASADNRRVLH
jgi:hypothetical protein